MCAGASGRRCPAHHAAPSAGEDISAPARLSGNALSRPFARRGSSPSDPFGPAILKTAGFGYDGKGQYRVNSLAEAEAAWNAMGRQEAVLEAVVDFEAELSVIGGARRGRRCVFYAPSANHCRRHPGCLFAPGAVRARCREEAMEITRGILEQLKVIGVLCVEFFLTRDDDLLVNELAPRPHNSGTSDDRRLRDQPVRTAVAGRVRIAAGQYRNAAPRRHGESAGRYVGERGAGLDGPSGNTRRKAAFYGKSGPRPGRKMGHLTATAASASEAERLVRMGRSKL